MKSKTTATFLLIGTFLLGAVTGAVSVSLYTTQGESAGARNGGPRPPRRDMVEDLARDLKMDAEQKEKLRVILNKTGERFKQLHGEVGPRFNTVREEGRQEIRTILRDDQKPRFEEIMRDIDSRRHKRDRPPR